MMIFPRYNRLELQVFIHYCFHRYEVTMNHSSANTMFDVDCSLINLIITVELIDKQTVPWLRHLLQMIFEGQPKKVRHIN